MMPFSGGSSDAIDQWSLSVFEALRDWTLAGSGRWFRSDEGWIRLRIEEFEGEPLEPLGIELSTFNEEIELHFGSWCTPIFRPSGPTPRAAELASARARELIEGWIRGEVKLASYSDETGWRGSKIIHGGELPAAVEPVPVEIGSQGQVIVKTCWRRDWRSWRHAGKGLWIECDTAEG
jgi:hypothetical protein